MPRREGEVLRLGTAIENSKRRAGRRRRQPGGNGKRGSYTQTRGSASPLRAPRRVHRISHFGPGPPSSAPSRGGRVERRADAIDDPAEAVVSARTRAGPEPLRGRRPQGDFPSLPEGRNASVSDRLLGEMELMPDRVEDPCARGEANAKHPSEIPHNFFLSIETGAVAPNL